MAIKNMDGTWRKMVIDRRARVNDPSAIVIALLKQLREQLFIQSLKLQKMENQTLKIVREFVTAVQQGDQQKLGVLLHPDVKWHQPGSNRLSGLKQSNMEVFGMVGGMYEISQGTLALTDIKFVAVNGDSAACLLHFQARRPGALLDVDNVDVYKVKDGQIVAATIYSADIDQENIFWGN
jgi:ketosteroid isomerase-like protein